MKDKYMPMKGQVKYEKYMREAAKLLEEVKFLKFIDSKKCQKKRKKALWYVERIVHEFLKVIFYDDSVYNIRLCDKEYCTTIKWQEKGEPGIIFEMLLCHINKENGNV